MYIQSRPAPGTHFRTHVKGLVMLRQLQHMIYLGCKTSLTDKSHKEMQHNLHKHEAIHACWPLQTMFAELSLLSPGLAGTQANVYCALKQPLSV